MQKHVNLVDLVKSFPTNIFLQNLASIQKRTCPIKFAHLAEKSEKGSTSNLSTKVPEPAPEDNFGPVRKNSASSDGHVAETKELIDLVAAFEETVMKKLDELMRKVTVCVFGVDSIS